MASSLQHPHGTFDRARLLLVTIRASLVSMMLLTGACQTTVPVAPPQPDVSPIPAPPVTPKPAPAPAKPAPAASAPRFKEVTWAELPGWNSDPLDTLWPAWLRSCEAMKNQAAWRDACGVAMQMPRPDAVTVRRFFETSTTPYRIVDDSGNDEGLATGYYEPLLRGSRKPSTRFRYPVYGVPEDLLVIDIAGLYPELKGMRLRGRLDGKRVVPYFDRSQIENGQAPVKGREIAWVDDPVELFFLQIQGSGRIWISEHETLRVGYADQNGHPYRSIGRWLVDRGELPLERASMQGIKAWAKANPARLQELLNHNSSYVFFRQLPANLPGPLGALGVPLTAERSIAIDPRYIPLGAPVYLSATWPNTTRPLNRLMVAQDTGGAIRGAVRADYFWGFGNEAGEQAGRMKQPLRLWLLYPRGETPPVASN